MANEDEMKEIDKVDRRLARLEVTVATEFQKIGQSFSEVHVRFDRVDQRLDRVDQRLDRVDQRLERVDQRFGRLEAAFKTQDVRISEGFRDIAMRIDRLASPRTRRGKRQ